ncbi:MAG: Do family serine endopeptidase [Sphingomonadales bacterium]
MTATGNCGGFKRWLAVAAAMMAAAMPFSSRAQDIAAPAQVAPQTQADIKLSFSNVVRQAGPAVVNIYTQKTVQRRASPFAGNPFFERFFGGGLSREQVMRSLGSGVIVNAEGLVVTNYHVAGDADEIRVVLSDRREFAAEVILSDQQTDLAVLRIDAEDQNFPHIGFGDSDAVEVGDVVLAIGNPFGVGQTVTSGIISALARTGVGVSDYQYFIQTDAAINPGNSGGALIDSRGQLIGINTAIFSQTGSSIGIGFAIPVNMVRFVVHAAQTGDKVVRPWIGIGGQTVDQDIAASLGQERPAGMLIDNVEDGSAAAAAGLQAGDIIVAVKGREVTDAGSVKYRLSTEPLGSQVPLTVLRDGARQQVLLEMRAPPEDIPRNITLLEGENVMAGLHVGNLSPAFAQELGMPLTSRGVIVVEVEDGSYAGRLGLFRPGDVIEELNNTEIERVEDLVRLVAETEPVEIVYRLRRDGRPMLCGFRPPGSLSCRR